MNLVQRNISQENRKYISVCLFFLGKWTVEQNCKVIFGEKYSYPSDTYTKYDRKILQ